VSATAAAVDEALPLVTVVVPALDEERSISACLDALLAQTHDALEVLVLDGGSKDRTREVVADYSRRDPRVRLVDNPRRTQPAALNTAWPVAGGEYLVRMDAHATVAPTYIEGVVRHLESGEYGGVGGRKDAVGFTPTGRAIAAVLGSPFGVGNSAYHHATRIQTVDHVPFGAYPMEVVRELGGWDESTPVNEDFEFDLRVRKSGRKLLLDPRLTIAWEGRQTIRLFARQYRRYGRGKSKVVLKSPEGTALRHLAAPAVVAAIALVFVIAPWRPRWAIALVAPYLGVLAVGSATIAVRLTSSEERRAVPAALAAMHLSWGLGFWEGIFGADVVQRTR
jgi:cellulose synthase/poly-beta-1,6-N-acetylglucosamine synthase-like glycosyltransferase